MAGTARIPLLLLIGICIAVSIFAQDLSQADPPEANAFLDVYFKHEDDFIDDVRIDEISINNRKNIRAVAIKPIDSIPLHTAILIDISASQVNHIKEIRWLYEGIIQALPFRSVDSARLFFFNDEMIAVRDATSSRSHLLKGFENIRLAGGTAVYDAVYYACQTLAPQAESRKSIMIFSDGVDHDSRMSLEETYREAIKNNIRVYLFAMKEQVKLRSSFFRWSSKPDKNYEKHKKNIEKTGGKVVLFSDTESAGEQFRQIVDEWNHLRRIDLCVDASGKSASGLELSVSRKGVKAYHPSTPQSIDGKSCSNDPGR